MLKQLKEMRRKSDQKGFTIIEVLIVLAIAGLIMVVVFLAVPNLQKSQRNSGRKTDANNAMSALSDYISNNGGQVPATCAAGACTWLSSLKTSQFDVPTNVSYVNISSGGTIPTMAADKMFLLSGATCASAAGAPTAPAGTPSRQTAVYYYIEGSVGSQCISQ